MKTYHTENRTRMTRILEIARIDTDFIRKSVKGVIYVPLFCQY